MPVSRRSDGPSGDPPRVGPDRQGAPPAQLGQEGPFRLHRRPHRRIVDGVQGGPGGAVVHPALDGQSALTHLGEHDVGLEDLDDHALGGDQPRRSRAAWATTTAAIPSTPTLASRVARLPRSPVKVRSGRRLANCTLRRAEPVATIGAGGEGVETAPDQDVAGIGPLGEGRQHQVGHVQLGRGRQVLGRVHGGIGLGPGPPRPAPP